jgi:hypothetical protein
LKSLSAKWRHFAESLLFKGLIAFLFRRFPLAALRAIRAVQTRHFPRPAHPSWQFGKTKHFVALS